MAKPGPICCPSCGTAGKSGFVGPGGFVTCPKCRVRFKAGGVPPAKEETTEEETPASQSQKPVQVRCGSCESVTVMTRSRFSNTLVCPVCEQHAGNCAGNNAGHHSPMGSPTSPTGNRPTRRRSRAMSRRHSSGRGWQAVGVIVAALILVAIPIAYMEYGRVQEAARVAELNRIRLKQEAQRREQEETLAQIRANEEAQRQRAENERLRIEKARVEARQYEMELALRQTQREKERLEREKEELKAEQAEEELQLEQEQQANQLELKQTAEQLYFEAQASRRHLAEQRNMQLGTLAAVNDAAGKWLVAHQGQEGGWSARGFTENCPDSDPCLGVDFNTSGGIGPGRGNKEFDVGVTAFAQLALLSGGHSHLFSPNLARQEALRRSLAYLVKQQADNGAIGYKGEEQEIYNHIYATLSLSRFFRNSEDPALAPILSRATSWLVSCNQRGGGWAYSPETTSYSSAVTGAALVALAAAREAGIEFDDMPVQGGIRWLDSITSSVVSAGSRTLVGYGRISDGGAALNPKFLGAPTLYPKFNPTPTLSALSLAARLSWGGNLAKNPLKALHKQVEANFPSHGATSEPTTNFYYWHYGALALIGNEQTLSANSKKWCNMLLAALVDDKVHGQIRAGHARGSWAPTGEWAVAGGRVFSTAINSLSISALLEESLPQSEDGLEFDPSSDADEDSADETQAVVKKVRARVLGWLGKRKAHKCRSCRGTQRVTCPKCSGNGRFIVIGTGAGAKNYWQRCGRCVGRGSLYCGKCRDRNDGLSTEHLEKTAASYGLAGAAITAYRRSTLAVVIDAANPELATASVEVKQRGAPNFLREKHAWKRGEDGAWRVLVQD